MRKRAPSRRGAAWDPALRRARPDIPTMAPPPGWPPAGRLLLLGLGSLWVALMGRMAARAQAPTDDVFLHATWLVNRGSGSFGPAVTLPGQPSMVVDNVLNNGRVYIQNASLDVSDEFRWGSLFDPEWSLFVRASIPSGDSPEWMVLALEDEDGPVKVLYTRQWVTLFSSSTRRSFPGGPVSLLAGAAVARDHADLLGLAEPPDGPREVRLWELTNGTLARVTFGVEVAAGQPANASPGPGRTFYLSTGSDLWHVRHGGVAAGPAAVQSIPLPAGTGTIRQLAATRVVTDAGQCPGAADVVMLLDGDQVHVLPCGAGGAGSPGEAGSGYAAALPAGASAATGRLVSPPPAPALDEAYPFLYFLQPGPGPGGAPMRLWRADVRSDGLSWRQLLLPPGHTAPGHLQLVRLRLTLSGPSSGEWALLADQHVLLESERFRCHTDESIVCDGPGGLTGGALGWVCAPTRAMAPHVVPGQLCGDCAEEHYLDRPEDEPPFSSPGHVCRACADSACRTCDRHDCLVCKGARVRQPTGPGGAMVCVDACSEGFALWGGVCLPAGLDQEVARFDAAGRETLPGPVLGSQVTGVGATRLGVDLATGLATIPPPGTEPGNVLLFAGPGRDPLLMGMEDIGHAGKAPPAAVRLFVQPPAEAVLGVAELGPTLNAEGRLVMALLLAERSGRISLAWLSCQPAGPGQGCTVAEPSALIRTGIQTLPAIRRLDERHVYVTDDSLVSSIFWADMDRLTWHNDWQAASDLLPLRKGWVVHVSIMEQAGVGPLAMLVQNDARWWWNGVMGGLLPADPNWGTYRAVLLPRGPGPGAAGPEAEAIDPGPELVLVLDTTAAAWDVVRVPGSLPSAGGTGARRPSTLSQRLGLLPEAPDLAADMRPSSRVFGVRLAGGSAEYPSALVLLSQKYVALSVLWCRPGGRSAACVLLPAVLTDLPAELHLTARDLLWAEPVVYTPAGPSPNTPGLLVSVLTFAEARGPVYLHLRVPCPSGTVGKGCLACADACAECWVPGDATACVRCPPGRFLAAGGGTCSATCAAGTTPGTGDREGICVPCPPGTAGPTCDPCHATCVLCSSPGDAMACLTCQPGHLMTALGSCVEECIPGTMPGIDDGHEGTCVPCPASCLD
ncbi:hypothetical protein H696_05302 [Fonticula alba]|uniref:Uncharacterized protein n=1 Tax=Fonticula alba TaxID=691883 RepID=A0A058Z2M7_FONAL|nr:hypothetical protein H696_05302 [Fonticula alba]KCV68386.1 hypothetical protein H696_05302 [Fonticula alba]|eukprot:XP_009497440.1 hypothetical protein H696_05302 [Fonticula alba]